MKKIALLLALVLAITCCLVGCGSTGETTGTDTASTTAASDLADVKAQGKLVVGITDFAPMDYRDENGNWIGFDADMAKAFGEYLGVDVEFIEIVWDNKAFELESGAIDVVWNGMTLTDEVKGLMGTGEAYCKNAQVVVTKKDVADQYTTTDSVKDLKFAVENGSAGAEALDAIGVSYTAMDTQAKALMEVSSGAADACVIDLLMAGAMVGEGTSYADLAITSLELTSEEYGVGFRKDSDLIAEFNTFWKKAYDDGTVTKTAETYGIAQNIIAK